MNVLISVLKKDGGKFEKAVEFNPALMSLGETVQDVLANATFHEWGSVLVEFDYKEKALTAHEMEMEDFIQDIEKEMEISAVHGKILKTIREQEAEKEYATSELREAIDAKFNEGIPADYVAHTKPPEFK